jgi:UDP-N-acetylmuramate dehydrogenase
VSAVAAALQARLEGAVLEGELLAGYTTLKVGGPAAAMVRAESEADLVAVAQVCRDHAVPWLVVGRGSNLLIADEGWAGVVVTLGRGFRGVWVAPNAPADIGAAITVAAGAAEPMPVLANAVAAFSLGGLEFGVAIPGSLGGAVRMNAGAHGGQMRDVLLDATVVRLGSGAVETIPADALTMTYRHTTLPADAVVVRARLQLRRADPQTLAASMAAMRQWRREHQPVNQPSCGSVFRNPDGDSAGRLIEAAGMKGYRVGGAQVSDVHANFITVDPGSRAADVRAVILAVIAAVEADSGVHLQTEVVLAGFDAPATGTGGP